MASPAEKLAKSLETLAQFQVEGRHCVKSSELGRTDRERLLRNGFLKEVMKGWYIASRPGEPDGESTAWYATFWEFCAEYLTNRFGDQWCLSPDQSLLLHAGNWIVPRQLLVRADGGSNRPVRLLHGTSLLDVRQELPPEADRQMLSGMRVYALDAALVAASPNFYVQNPTDARALLATQRDAGPILARLLDGGRTAIAGRLAGAFRNIGADRIADDMLSAMKAAGHTVKEVDSFDDKIGDFVFKREPSPYVQRIRLMWHNMRSDIIGKLPKPAAQKQDIDSYLHAVDDIYLTDAYHSLSIEGYRVTPELIERVRCGNWNLEIDETDRQQRDAMAARGYHLCFQAVHRSVEQVLKGANAGKVADDDHSGWYRQMFGPSVEAGLVEASSLAGYRNGQIFIRNSHHRPLNVDAVRDTMPVFFELLAGEEDPAVRIVLGHFIFVYIHPYMDGNGRMGRFLMNVMMAAGGYHWTVIPVERRRAYMEALEAASTRQDIVPFTEFLAQQIGNPVKKIEEPAKE